MKLSVSRILVCLWPRGSNWGRGGGGWGVGGAVIITSIVAILVVVFFFSFFVCFGYGNTVRPG